MKLKYTKKETIETFDHSSGEMSTNIKREWTVIYKNEEHTRKLDSDGVKWDQFKIHMTFNYPVLSNPNIYPSGTSSGTYVIPTVPIQQMSSGYSNYSNIVDISNEELEEKFKIMMREKKLENIVK
jgi:hypothetical protein